jgi:hypothetical protein
MQSKHNHARPIVLRELSLLRALGASLRTSSYRPGRLGRPSLARTVLPPPDPFARVRPEEMTKAVESR